ncbi:extracellular catalytic domain type 2 short-chain-length polyhydroxyalkanoate depolymerase [Arenimonas fontis]|uniref:Poly(3-hydroxybutyrate) depolymerase n=1 Tax=Arenimonas fontis TaxID=2608255 RepID=A0A5B2ZDR2_9GAMM|nr:PHB depolymerase family esterase [Arenimonas fontis]KAA2286167.1 hypothetical protein F0415_01300 [Arenimonas fontis]
MSQRAAHAARLFLLSAMVLVAACGGSRGEPLPRLDIERGRVAVAGLSSGAYMAAQAHLALAERLDGVALIAGGPPGCAQGQLQVALGPCMVARPHGPDVPALLARARERAADGRAAPLSALAGDRVLVMHGTEDATVNPAVGAAARDFYTALVEEGIAFELTWDGERRFGHVWPTVAEGGDCLDGGSPWLGACGFDAAGEVMHHLFGPVEGAPGEPRGELRRFGQAGLAADGGDPLLADEGFLYLPPECAAGEACGLLVAFHGCQQDIGSVGDTFARGSGLNAWADLHRVAVLYPQARSSYLPLNPKACWDWWGYTGEDYDTRTGAQLRWLAAVLDALGAP